MANISRGREQRFIEKIQNFPRNLYRIDDRNSHIFKFLYAILEIGVGQIKSLQDLANQSQNSLAGTEGADLDKYFQLFGLKRTPNLIYNGNLFQNNSIETFQEFKSLDALFRVQISKMLQAMQKGGTPEGLKLMAEAASSYPAQVIEPWQNEEYTLQGPRFASGNNEALIFIFPDIILNEEEKTNLKSRVINSLEMIRPANSVLTVKIFDPVNAQSDIISPDYAAAGNFQFLSDGSKQYLELISQEKEIDLNEFVIDAKVMVTNENFSNFIGFLQDNGDFEDALLIQETNSPKTSQFLAQINDDEYSEIVLVHNRYLIEKDDETFFMYEVTRAQRETTKIDWNTRAAISGNSIAILTNFSTMIVPNITSNFSFGNWISIPLADSPDNYPAGLFPNNIAKYDTNGNYLFEWPSQSEFIKWFRRQIESVGGEILGNNYRLPNGISNTQVGFNLMAALGVSYPIIRPIITPKNNE